MAVILLPLLMAVGVWADQLPLKYHHEIHNNSEKTVTLENQLPVKTQNDREIRNEKLPVKITGRLTRGVFDKAAPECAYPFEPVGNNCYFFSDEHRNFDGAINYCNSLDHGYDVTLAMLDYDVDEDTELLLAASNKDKTFWVGGKTEDGHHWEWQDGREINLKAPFWHYNEPNENDSGCTAAQVITYGSTDKRRLRLYDNDCSESFNFICQIGCPFEFRRIGKYCYFLSEEEGLDHVTWQDARDYCQALAVPTGYHADLAVLGLPDEDGYTIMDNLIGSTTFIHHWVGAYAETNCDFKWIDGRSLPGSSTYWYYNRPFCGQSDYRVLLEHYTTQNRTYLFDRPETNSFPFICQMLQD